MRLILVEDEPAAMRHLRAIIETRCSGWEVVETAEDGGEAIGKILRLRPDAVITDIRMPGMDGMALLEHIARECPEVRRILVSGHQDFDYARGAIRLGVSEYLLKPVGVQQVQQLLDGLYTDLVQLYRDARVSLCRRHMAGLTPEPWHLEKYLPSGGYRAALVRVGGLPSRFAPEESGDPAMPGSGMFLTGCPAARETEWIVPGRDARELLVFSVSEEPDDRRFRDVVRQVSDWLPEGFRTIVMAGAVFTLSGMKAVRDGLYRLVDRSLVTGKDQWLFWTPQGVGVSDAPPVLADRQRERMQYLLVQDQAAEIRQELIRLFDDWERAERPQWWVEGMLHQILMLVDRHTARVPVENTCAAEAVDVFYPDEVLRDAASFGEVMAACWAYVESRMGHAAVPAGKLDTPALVREVEAWMDRSLSQPMTLQSICSVFGVSQTYLSRLFRRYGGRTFSERLTAMRITRARQLMGDNPGMPLKQVAALVGYEDPFYFSKVFRAVVGMPPSQYAEGLPQGRDGRC